MKHLPRKAIASTPELTNRAPFSVVIDSFLVGAANYTIGHHDREGTMFLDKFHNFLSNADVFSNVTTKRCRRAARRGRAAARPRRVLAFAARHPVHILWGDAQWMSRFDGWERPATPIKQSDHML